MEELDFDKGFYQDTEYSIDNEDYTGEEITEIMSDIAPLSSWREIIDEQEELNLLRED